MSELKIINTKQYNSELDEVCKNKTDIFIKTKLTRRVTFGEYQFEPKNGFETDNAYYSQPINLDKCEVYYLHQPTLNENQQLVLEGLKREHFDSYIKSVLSNLYFYVNEQRGELYKDINSGIKRIAGVGSRTQLRSKHYDQVVEFIQDWEPSTATKSIVRQMSLDLAE